MYDPLLLGEYCPKPIDLRCASCIFFARRVLADISRVDIWGAKKAQAYSLIYEIRHLHTAVI